MTYAHALVFNDPERDLLAMYDAVNAQLGILEDNWPDGLLTHVGGTTQEGGLCVIEVWDSKDSWDAFFGGRLQPAFQAVGDVPTPQVTAVDVRQHFQR